MSRIVYPRDGLMRQARGKVSECSQSISEASSYCSFSVPSRFGYKNYLWGLRDRINSFNRELYEIQKEIQTTDNSYDNTSKRAISRILAYEKVHIKTRERMIE